MITASPGVWRGSGGGGVGGVTSLRHPFSLTPLEEHSEYNGLALEHTLKGLARGSSSLAFPRVERLPSNLLEHFQWLEECGRLSRAGGFLGGPSTVFLFARSSRSIALFRYGKRVGWSPHTQPILVNVGGSFFLWLFFFLSPPRCLALTLPFVLYELSSFSHWTGHPALPLQTGSV